ncbi:hemerythrin domain-containing protein [Actinophytocola glycyrrhizae]|uniref:Hemerythrin domain-containing protein n=1 Tax=Actinophytocola glycyrrhizae TaxID=2044873 RepID=A0ABV9S460_9PSEU
MTLRNMPPSKHEATDSVRRFCVLMAAMNDRLTAFGNQLIVSHIRLRELLDELRDGTYAEIDLATHCLTFCSVLAAHHSAEDEQGFPVLAKHFPELGPVLTELMHDHRQVAEVLDRLKAVSTMDVVDAGRELETLAALLETHLVYEEKKLVAALNRLSPTVEEARAVARAVTLSQP